MVQMSNVFLRRFDSHLGQIASQINRVQIASCQISQAWAPAINAYRWEGCFVICVELAGVDRSCIDVQVEPRRLWIRGQRPLPEPQEPLGPPLHLLAMEIDHGPFAREVLLPAEVEPGEVLAEQRNGLLWITLPLRSPHK